MDKSTQGSLKSAYKHTKPLWTMKYKEIKSFHMQDIIDGCGCSYSTQWAIKNLFGHLDKFALEVDVINKGYAQLTTAEPIPETSKEPFTDEEVNALWEIKDQEWVDSVLVFMYSGFRISELLNMKTDCVNLDDKTFLGGIKTKAGKGRIVPIHSLIYDIVKNRVNQGHDYLFTLNGKKVSQTYYRDYWKELMTYLEIEKTPHECRHTFESKLDSAGANRKCIDLMMGHKSKDVGNRVYNHKTLQELKTAIELVTR